MQKLFDTMKFIVWITALTDIFSHGEFIQKIFLWRNSEIPAMQAVRVQPRRSALMAQSHDLFWFQTARERWKHTMIWVRKIKGKNSIGKSRIQKQEHVPRWGFSALLAFAWYILMDVYPREKTQIHEKGDKKSEEKNRNSGAASKSQQGRELFCSGDSTW